MRKRTRKAARPRRRARTRPDARSYPCGLSAVAKATAPMAPEMQRAATGTGPRNCQRPISIAGSMPRMMTALCGSATLRSVSAVASWLAALSMGETLPMVVFPLVGSAVLIGLFLCLRSFDAEDGTDGDGGHDGGGKRGPDP